ncbi:hypothetical protein F5Y18DRAFT_430269 [Xylariaceae sp. FL1019]|nr:hypothetical protein F5Y18DRAFT_430269 [Xylariaceae sp. FL1019]
MGWLWASPPPPPSGGNIKKSEEKPTAPPKAPEPQYSDPELAKFIAQVQAEFGDNSKPSETEPTRRATAPKPKPTEAAEPISTPSTATSASSWSPWGSSTPKPSPFQSDPTPYVKQPASAQSPSADGKLDPLSESLLPTTMSCRQAFDHAFHCNSLGGQWTSVYRSGGIRSCSEQWDDFWFCMRTRVYTGEMKENAIRDYYRKKEIAKYGEGMPKSTDIWEARTERLEGAFQERYELPDMSDTEWRRQDLERRRKIREASRKQEERERQENAS